MEYLSADVEDKYVIAQANTPLTDDNEFVRTRVSSRYHSGFLFTGPESIDYMDVAPHQIVGISAALIPFLEHNDANRALMGSNMQAQAVPLIRPDIPQVSTGMEYHAARDSGQVIVALEDGEVTSVTGSRVVVQKRRTKNGITSYANISGPIRAHASINDPQWLKVNASIRAM
jgi:DNA-directed RNA polymerase subunit beta